MEFRDLRVKANIAAWINSVVLAFLILTLAAALCGYAFPQCDLVLQVLLGGFIGGITNKIAIIMLFQKKWYLPGSGVLLKKHKDIICSLASTVEKHLVNSEMLQAEIKKLLKPVTSEKIGHILNNLIDDFRGDLRKYLQSKSIHAEVRAALKTKLGFVGRFLNATHIRQYDTITNAIIRELLERIDRLRVSQQLVFKTMQRIGTLEEFLFKPNNELMLRCYQTDRSIAQLFFDNLDIESMVGSKLETYAPSKVRDIIEENIGSHLLWLEIFGVLLGMLFAGGVFLFMRAMSLPT